MKRLKREINDNNKRLKDKISFISFNFSFNLKVLFYKSIKNIIYIYLSFI
jgi:hypothetical protein